ncbi:MAG: hypothetical protein HOA14_06955, partial [Planctomycetaceae bacterium]|nr:hypothetical protein [Planctomycetaceae bacterium]
MTASQPTPIYDQLNTLDAIDSSYDKRKAIDELDQDVTYSVSVILEKIAKNYSYVREDGYRDSYYVTGTISDSEHRVKVIMPATMNSAVASWNEGETIVLEAVISDWDLAYKQFGLLGRSSIGVETEVDSVADEVAKLTPHETEPLTSNTDGVENEAEHDLQSVDPIEQADIIKPQQRAVIVEEVEPKNDQPGPVDRVEAEVEAEVEVEVEAEVEAEVE